jgi:hypothetical protein
MIFYYNIIYYYKKMFRELSVKQLKQVIREYNHIIKIKVTGLSKSQLLEAIEKRLDIDSNGKITIKPFTDEDMEKGNEVKMKEKKESEMDLMRLLAKLRGEKVLNEKLSKSKDEKEKNKADMKLVLIEKEMKLVASKLLEMRNGSKKDSNKKDSNKKGSEKMEKDMKEDMEEAMKKVMLLKNKRKSVMKKIQQVDNLAMNKKDMETVEKLKKKSKSMMDKIKETDKIVMSKKELLKEHQKLIPLLKTGTKKSRVKEANDQAKEMVKYEPAKPKKKTVKKIDPEILKAYMMK